MGERPQVFGQDAERTGIRVSEEGLFTIGKWPPERIDVRTRLRALVVAVSQTPILAPLRGRILVLWSRIGKIRAMPGRNVFTVLADTEKEFRGAAALHQPRKGKKGEYESYSWSDWLRISTEIAAGLAALGMRKG